MVRTAASRSAAVKSASLVLTISSNCSRFTLPTLAVFGVPELHRDKIKNAQLVSCPGCMAVTSMLALAPLIRNELIDTEHIVVDSKIGSSGAGAGGTSGTQHAMRAGVIRPYKPAKHRHTGEIEQELSEAAGKKIKVSMKNRLRMMK